MVKNSIWLDNLILLVTVLCQCLRISVNLIYLIIKDFSQAPIYKPDVTINFNSLTLTWINLVTNSKSQTMMQKISNARKISTFPVTRDFKMAGPACPPCCVPGALPSPGGQTASFDVNEMQQRARGGSSPYICLAEGMGSISKENQSLTLWLVGQPISGAVTLSAAPNLSPSTTTTTIIPPCCIRG